MTQSNKKKTSKHTSQNLSNKRLNSNKDYEPKLDQNKKQLD